jgi:hypothetical protein
MMQANQSAAANPAVRWQFIRKVQVRQASSGRVAELVRCHFDAQFDSFRFSRR